MVAGWSPPSLIALRRALAAHGTPRALIVLGVGLIAIRIPPPSVLEQSVLTSWLGGFYLPRLASTDSSLLEGLRWPLSRLLVALGLFGLATAIAAGTTYPRHARRGAAAAALTVLTGAWVRWPTGSGLVALAIGLESWLAAIRMTSGTSANDATAPAPAALAPSTSVEGEAEVVTGGSTIDPTGPAPSDSAGPATPPTEASPAPTPAPQPGRRARWVDRAGVVSRALAILVLAVTARRLALARVPLLVLDERLVAMSSVRLEAAELRADVACALAAPGVVDRLRELGSRSVLVHILPADAGRLADLGVTLAADGTSGPMGTPEHPRRVAVFCALGPTGEDAPAATLVGRPGTWSHPLFAVALEGPVATLLDQQNLRSVAPLY